MVKGLYRRGANFAVGWWVLRLCPSNHTCSPLSKFTGIRCSLEVRRASSALSWASLICCNHIVTSGVVTSSSDKGNGGFTLKRSSCGVSIVRSWGQELWTNSASDKNCAQVDWSSAVQIRRYCLSHWLACSPTPSVTFSYPILTPWSFFMFPIPCLPHHALHFTFVAAILLLATPFAHLGSCAYPILSHLSLCRFPLRSPL
jgi:hypothetical protein